MKKRRRKKRRGRLRIDRIIMVLFILSLIIFSIKFVSYLIYNNKVYNAVIETDTNYVEINKKYNKIRLFNKTIDLFKESNRSLILNDKKYSLEIKGKKLKNGTHIDVDLYNDKLEYEHFPNIKAYFIDNTNISKYASKITTKLPKYLRKNKVVDVYGVKNDNIIQVMQNINIDDKITIDLDSQYDKYFIVYVRLEDMKISANTINKGSIVNLTIKYIPETATIKDFEYTKIGDIFMLNEENQIIAVKEGTSEITIKHKIENIKKTIKVTVENKSIKNIDGLTYVDDILIANKTYGLPKDYDPGKLNAEVLNAFYDMREAASEDGITLWIASGYRSYSTQKELYDRYVLKDGKEKAETYSARPGFSEHQTGLAMDLNIVNSSFEGTKEAIWIENNCYKYGFIVRYPKGKENITGYKYEPWHIRYLGKDLSKKIYDSNLTLEEYLGIDSKYSE